MEPINFTCNVCQKVCKSKGGLTRHNQKHTTKESKNQIQTSVTQDDIFNLLKEEESKAEENLCYSEVLWIKLKETNASEEFLWLTALDLWNAFCTPFEKLLKNRDAENFTVTAMFR